MWKKHTKQIKHGGNNEQALILRIAYRWGRGVELPSSKSFRSFMIYIHTVLYLPLVDYCILSYIYRCDMLDL